MLDPLKTSLERHVQSEIVQFKDTPSEGDSAERQAPHQRMLAGQRVILADRAGLDFPFSPIGDAPNSATPIASRIGSPGRFITSQQGSTGGCQSGSASQFDGNRRACDGRRSPKDVMFQDVLFITSLLGYVVDRVLDDAAVRISSDLSQLQHDVLTRQDETMASASISTSYSPTRSFTSIRVLAGKISRNMRPWARATSSQRDASFM